jgi:hypothetical protein
MSDYWIRLTAQSSVFLFFFAWGIGLGYYWGAFSSTARTQQVKAEIAQVSSHTVEHNHLR